jgi:glycosyltransferase involved in cell wall biosynthesis
MGKKQQAQKPKSLINGKFYPMVSVCTPTFNRRPFIPIMLECFRNQTYPKERIEWIIVDDGTDKVKDLIDAANIPQIKYFSVKKKMLLGEKRNYMHQHVTGSIIVYMDDDDYYPPERIEHAVERLQSNRDALCAGSSEIYIYFKHIQKMYQCGPYGPNHATAGTFAFRQELLKKTQYENTAALAEEKSFLKDYTIPFVQLDPLKTILVFSHNHNTFDKKKLLENPHPDFCKESPKTVDMFIKYPHEVDVKKFFMEDIDKLLDKYEPGLPKMKPDVLKQTKEIEKKREEDLKRMQSDPANLTIMINKPGEAPRPMRPDEIVNILQEQQKEIEFLRSGGAGGTGVPGGYGPGYPPQIPKIMMNRPGETPREMTIEEVVALLQEQQRELEYYKMGRQDGPNPFQSPPFQSPRPVNERNVGGDEEEEFPLSSYPFIPPIRTNENPNPSFSPPKPNIPTSFASTAAQSATSVKYRISSKDSTKIEVSKLGDLPKTIGLKEIVALLEEQQTKIELLSSNASRYNTPNPFQEMKIMMGRPGEPQREASPQEIIGILQEQQNQLNAITKSTEIETQNYKRKIAELEKTIMSMKQSSPNAKPPVVVPTPIPDTSNKIHIELNEKQSPQLKSMPKTVLSGILD